MNRLPVPQCCSRPIAPRFLRRRLQAFSLIEMMTVVAVIVILAVLSFPVMEQTKKGALSAKCVARQKKVFQGLMAYASENNGYYPPSDAPNKGRWMFKVQEVLDGPIIGDGGEEPFLLEYKCPIDEEKVDTFVGVFCYNKNFGHFVSEDIPVTALSSAKIVQPARFPVLACHYPKSGGHIWENGYLSPRAREKFNYMGLIETNGASPNHGRMCNVTFADGHCAAIDASRAGGPLTTGATFKPEQTP